MNKHDITRFIPLTYLFFLRYAYNSEVGTYTPTYYTGTQQVQASPMGYDISADYAVDSTTTYDPRPGLDALDSGSLIASVVTTGEYKQILCLYLYCV